MLKVFRDNLRYFSWVLWIVIAAFILFYIPDFMTPTANPNVAVRVWDEEISYAELQNQLRDIETQFQQAGNQLPPNFAERMALQRLIDSKILLREARLVGLSVTDEELSKEILALPFLQGPDGKFIGEEEYVRLLRRNRLSPADFEAEQRERLLVQKLLATLTDNLWITDDEVERSYRESTERARIRYLQLPASRFAEEVQVSDEEVATYFEEHREEYRLPERREAAYLLVKLDQVRRTMEVDEGELFAYYQENEESFTREEQVRARHILLTTAERTEDEAVAQIEAIKGRIESGEDFATVAQETSEDPGSAPNGGDLGFFRRGQMTPEFEQAAFAGEPNELIGPVVTPFGVHLIRVEAKQESGVRPFAEVRAQIRATLAAQKAPEQIQSQADALVEELRAMPGEELTPETLRSKAEASVGALVFNEPGSLAREDSIPGIGRPPAFFDTLFEMEAGELSDPVELPNGDRALIYLEKIDDPRDQELEEVQEAIRSELGSAKQQQMAVSRLDEARQALEGGGKTLDQVAEELELTPQETQEFGPQGLIQGLGYNAKVAQAALSIQEGEVGGPFESGSGALIFEVLERKTGNPEEFEQRKEQLRTSLLQQRQQRLLSSLVLERRDQLRADNELEILSPDLRSLMEPS